MATPFKKNRIVILDDEDSADDDTSSSPEPKQRGTKKIARRKAIMKNQQKRQEHYFPRLSDSSSDLEAYIRDMKITSSAPPGTTWNHDVDGDDDDDDENNNNNINEDSNKIYRDEKIRASSNNVKHSPDAASENVDDDDNDMDQQQQQQQQSAWKFDPVSREYYLASSSSSSSLQQQNNVALPSSLSSPTVVWPELRLPANLYRSLYSFQKVGVQWAASLYHHNATANGITGGCLGDDMGMGKTFTTLTTLGGLMRAGTIHNALVVAPLSVLRTWEKEANRILLQCVSRPQQKMRIIVLSSETPAVRRQGILRDALKYQRGSKYLIITTYGLVRSSYSDFTNGGGGDGGPLDYFDYIILDEGHQIKNSNAAVSQRCREICGPYTRRLLVTGTPLMNNLMEVFCLFDFATGGKVLGSRQSFREYYVKPIEAARERTASRGIIEHGQRKSKELQALLKPYFLQRLKIDYLKDKLPPKHELVVWTHLSETQRAMYREFVDRGAVVKEIMRGEKNSPLEAITWLKKLCGHPLIARPQQEMELGDVLEQLGPDEVIAQSAKLDLLVRLVSKLRRKGHRTLIFSQSTKTLDIIEFVLQNRLSLSRIDGSTKEKDRQARVDEFNSEFSDTDAMILSTKAAGVGLTLVGADACIIYDPSWTPALDSQAVDRCYRISQTKEVHVYRLIAAGTVEEKMYEKQIEKDGIRRTIFSDDTDVTRYFDKSELSNLFKLAPPGVCDVMNKVQGRMGQQLDWKYNAFISSLNCVVGLSQHDGFYSVGSDAATKAKNNSAAPVVGDAKAAAKPLLGRAQRVLQRETNSIDKTYAKLTLGKDNVSLNQNITSNKAAVVDLCNSSQDECSYMEKENDSKQQAVVPPSTKKGSIATTTTSNNITKQSQMPSASKHNSNSTARVSCVLERVSEQERKGNPKRAMKLLLDLLEQNEEMTKAEKLQVHSRMATVAQRVGLLDHL